jgi:hypothetical protein
MTELPTLLAIIMSILSHIEGPITLALKYSNLCKVNSSQIHDYSMCLYIPAKKLFPGTDS